MKKPNQVNFTSASIEKLNKAVLLYHQQRPSKRVIISPGATRSEDIYLD